MFEMEHHEVCLVEDWITANLATFAVQHYVGGGHKEGVQWTYQMKCRC